MLAKTKQNNSRWTLEDNEWALKQHYLGKKSKYIARKLGRTEVAVQVHMSKMRAKLKAKASTIGPVPVPRPAVVKPTVEDTVQSEWITLFTGLAGGVFGATIMHFIWQQ